MKHRLEEHYCGDTAWNAFVETFANRWDACRVKEELVSALHGHLDIAKVVFGIMEDTSLAWVGRAIPALDGLSPVDCTTDADRSQRLKSMLMRMPV